MGQPGEYRPSGVTQQPRSGQVRFKFDYFPFALSLSFSTLPCFFFLFFCAAVVLFIRWHDRRSKPAAPDLVRLFLFFRITEFFLCVESWFFLNFSFFIITFFLFSFFRDRKKLEIVFFVCLFFFEFFFGALFKSGR